DDRDRVRAVQRAQLHRERAQAAAGAPDEHVVAGPDPGPVDQHPVGGEVGQPVRRRLLPGQLGRLRQELLGLDEAVLGEAAPVRLVGPDALARARHRVAAVALGALAAALVAVDDDLVALLPAGHARADSVDDPRRVGAGDMEVVARVAEDRDRQAGGGPDAVVVHAGGHDPDAHLAGAGRGDVDPLELHRLHRVAQPVGADHPGVHRARGTHGLSYRRAAELPAPGRRTGHGQLATGGLDVAAVGAAVARRDAPPAQL